LVKIITAATATGGLARRLYRREQEAYQDPYDRDNYKQLNERETM